MNTQRPPAVTVAVVLLALLSVVTMVPPSLMAPPAEAAEVPAFVTYLGFILGVVGLVAAYGLWALKRWSVWLTIILSAVSILLSVPPILFGLSVALFAATIALYIPARSVEVPSSWGAGGDSGELISLLPFLAFPVVGALIASRRPENPIGWICLSIGIFWMLGDVATAYGVYGLVARPGSVPFPAEVGSLGEWLWAPAVGLLGTYLILLFPNGRLPSRRWRPVAWLSGAVIVLFSVAEGLAPGPLENQGGVRNPFGLEELPWLADATLVILPLLPVCILASAVSLILRYRRSRGEEREQIKWLAFVASFAGLLYLIVLVSPFILVPEFLGSGGRLPPLPLWFELLFSVAALGFAGVPVAIGFAVLKYRLYAIDVVINRTLVYGSLTVLLAWAYVGGVVGLQAALRAVTGQESTLAVVASTLAIAALFSPLRRLVQGFVDRRFYRRKYDARKTLEVFSVRLRDETDLKALSDDLVGVARGTMQPEHVSLWLRPETSSEGKPTD